MTHSHGEFLGAVPDKYDRYLGPMLFDPYASDVVERLAPLQPSSVLEIACGTGIVTRRMRDVLPDGVAIVASDLNAAMVEVAARKFRPGENVTFTVADATRLPPADSSFDAVVCQFGVMFFPDKYAAFRECARVLQPGGHVLFNVWESLEFNELPRLADDTVRAHFPDDPPTFYSTPFGFHDRQLITNLVTDAGLRVVGVFEVTRTSESPTPLDVAMGLIEGSPVSAEISRRDPEAVTLIRDRLAARYEVLFGVGPVRASMRAIVFHVTKPK
jgi:ubiquinone/menaquinone biosynthesis C-methylase UbiE